MALNKTFLFVFLLIIDFCFAQNYYILYFKDKSNNQYSLNKPIDFLTQKSIDRRIFENKTIDSSDLPVSKHYIDNLKSQNINVLYTSKWLNAALVFDTSSKISALSNQLISSFQKVSRKENIRKYNSIEESNINTRNTYSNSAYGNSFTQLNMMNVDSLHSEGITGNNILIAVLDEGFLKVNKLKAFNHLILNNKIIDTYDFVNNKTDVFDAGEHGSKVLSCIASKLDNKLIGASYSASFLLYHTEKSSSEYPVEEFYYLLAAERADSMGADISTASLGYRDFDNPIYDHPYSDLDGKTTIAAKAVQFMARKGIIVINSAGNGGSSSFKYINTPGDADSILTVGAVTNQYTKTSFSSIGPSSDGRIKPDVVALGQDVVCANVYMDDSTITSSGTSFSAPLIAGFTALIKEKYPDLKSQEIINWIKNSSHNANNPNNLIGYGVPFYGIRDFNKPDVTIAVIDQKLTIKTLQPISNNNVNIKIYSTSGVLAYETDVILKSLIDNQFNINFLHEGPYICLLNNGEILYKGLIINR